LKAKKNDRQVREAGMRNLCDLQDVIEKEGRKGGRQREKQKKESRARDPVGCTVPPRPRAQARCTYHRRPADGKK
jgi:hypothetical protein